MLKSVRSLFGSKGVSIHCLHHANIIHILSEDILITVLSDWIDHDIHSLTAVLIAFQNYTHILHLLKSFNKCIETEISLSRKMFQTFLRWKVPRDFLLFTKLTLTVDSQNGYQELQPLSKELNYLKLNYGSETSSGKRANAIPPSKIPLPIHIYNFCSTLTNLTTLHLSGNLSLSLATTESMQQMMSLFTSNPSTAPSTPTFPLQSLHIQQNEVNSIQDYTQFFTFLRMFCFGLTNLAIVECIGCTLQLSISMIDFFPQLKRFTFLKNRPIIPIHQRNDMDYERSPNYATIFDTIQQQQLQPLQLTELHIHHQHEPMVFPQVFLILLRSIQLKSFEFSSLFAFPSSEILMSWKEKLDSVRDTKDANPLILAPQALEHLHLHAMSFTTQQSISFSNAFLPEPYALTSLSLCMLTDFTGETLVVLIDYCPGITSLTIQDIPSIRVPEWLDIFTQWQTEDHRIRYQLKVLNFQYRRNESGFSNVRTLSMGNALVHTFTSLEDFTFSLPDYYRTLSSSCVQLHNTLFLPPQQHLQKLKKWKFEAIQLVPDTAMNFEHIEYINTSSSEIDTRLRTIERIEFSNTILTISLLNQLLECTPRLRYLSLHGVYFLQDQLHKVLYGSEESRKACYANSIITSQTIDPLEEGDHLYALIKVNILLPSGDAINQVLRNKYSFFHKLESEKEFIAPTKLSLFPSTHPRESGIIQAPSIITTQPTTAQEITNLVNNDGDNSARNETNVDIVVCNCFGVSLRRNR
jgi:hypothetical protein